MACGKISRLVLAGDGSGPAWLPPASDPAKAAMPAVTITVDDPRASDIRTLVHRHLEFAASHKPPGDVHALDAAGLLDPAVTVFSCRADGQLLAIGALKCLGAWHAELKSMHTAEAARGREISRAMLAYLIAVARDRGIRRLSLKTGSQPAFAPARSVYARAGFTPCAPFSGYRPSASSTFMTLSLDPVAAVAPPCRRKTPLRPRGRDPVQLPQPRKTTPIEEKSDCARPWPGISTHDWVINSDTGHTESGQRPPGCREWCDRCRSMPSLEPQAILGVSRFRVFCLAACRRLRWPPSCAPQAGPLTSPRGACRCAWRTTRARRPQARRWMASTGCCWSRATSRASASSSTPTSSGRRGWPGSRASYSPGCSTPIAHPCRIGAAGHRGFILARARRSHSSGRGHLRSCIKVRASAKGGEPGVGEPSSVAAHNGAWSQGINATPGS